MADLIEIEKRLPNDWKFLEKVYHLLCEGKVFNISEKDKVIEFVQPEELKDIIDTSFSGRKPLDAGDVIKICQKVIKYSVKTNHPRFRNQLFGQIDPYGLAGAWITEALNTSSYTFEVAPVFSLIETEVIRTICKKCGYLDGDGIFSPGGSISNMYALVLARYKLRPETKLKGVFQLPELVFFTSEESHYSFKKSAHWLGIGTDNCITIKTDQLGKLSVEDLEHKILEAKILGKIPFFVNATAGSTVLGAFDNLQQISTICHKYGLWLHVDACHGGAVILSSKYKNLLNGLECSDSFAWNPHKALGAPLQCALFITKEKNLLSECNSTDASYLFQPDKFYSVSYDTGNKSIQCGRKIDAFKLWLMFKARGLSHYEEMIDHAIETAATFVEKVRNRNGFVLVQDTFQYTNICFWYIPKAIRTQERNEDWYKKLNEVAPKIKEKMVKNGSLMVGYSPLPYRQLVNFFRMVFTCFPILFENDLDSILDEIEILGESIYPLEENGYH